AWIPWLNSSIWLPHIGRRACAGRSISRRGAPRDSRRTNYRCFNMTLSVFDIFTVGIGPSSSHTVGPMRAARNFVRNLRDRKLLDRTASLSIDLYGSLAETGRGHATDVGIMLGLMGHAPDTVEPSGIGPLIAGVRETGSLSVAG